MNNLTPLTETATWKYTDPTYTYVYTDKDGDDVIGTLQEIGEGLIHWHGANRLTDNPMPWLDLDDYGTDSPREFTLWEWIEWVAKFEDRPRVPVLHNLRRLT